MESVLAALVAWAEGLSGFWNVYLRMNEQEKCNTEDLNGGGRMDG
jgi:hypothetical protein